VGDRGGGSLAADPDQFLVMPTGDGPFPGVVLAAEAFGINEFTRDVARRLAAEGFAVLVPDYYRGEGPTNPEGYDDFTEVMEHIAGLDFTQATRDVVDAVEALRALPTVDRDRVAVWGYCTGGTLAWLTACTMSDLRAAILFFPSQPRFEELGPSSPAHPLDLLWMLTGPTLFIYGSEDPVMPPDLLDDLRSRIDQWSVPAEVRVYKGGGHAFSAPWGPLRHAPSDEASWGEAVEFLQGNCGAGAHDR